MSVTIEQIVLDLKRVCIKQKDREALGDSLISETESVNKQIEAMKEVEFLTWSNFSCSFLEFFFFILVPGRFGSLK